MSKVLYSATISLDGYMAGPGGDMSWLRPFLGPNDQVDALQKDIKALLLGGGTFRGDDPHRGTEQEGAFGGTWEGPSFVVTSNPPPGAETDPHFHADLRSGLDAAKAAAGDGYVNVLGAAIGRQCLEWGEVDEVLAIVAPVFLGDGTPFFSRAGGRHVDFERISVKDVGHAVNYWLRVKKAP